MPTTFLHEINNKPKPEDVGVIKIYVCIIPSDYGDDDDDDEDNTIMFFTSSLVEELIRDQDCRSRKELELIFTQDAGIFHSESIHLMMDLISYVYEICESNDYSPNYLLSLWLTVEVHYDDEDDEEDGDYDDSYDEDDDEEVEDDVNEEEEDEEDDEYVEYYEHHGVKFRPANKFVIENFKKKIYKKTSKSIKETCTICLEEMKNGETVAILPCGHKFDEKCVMEWLYVSHVCPLCRFELPCD